MPVKLACIAALAAAMVCLSTDAASALGSSLSGTWTVEPDRGNSFELTLTSHWSDGNWEWASSVPFSDLSGLTASDLRSSGKTVRFTLHKPAGSFDCTGWAAQGKGGGTFVFFPDPSFTQALAARGIGALQPDQQLRLAINGLTLGFIDRLRNVGVRPSLADLMRMLDEGIDSDYVLALAKNDITGLSVANLINLRDHGVEPDYVAAIRRLGYSPSVSQLVKMMDHGVTAAWVHQVLSTGVHPSVDDLIRMRDAGV